MSQKLKAAIFAFALLAAAAVGIRSLLGKAGSSLNPNELPFATADTTSAGTIQEASCARNEKKYDGISILCGTTLHSLDALNEVAADKDAVFIMLPGEAKGPVKEAADQVYMALKKVSARGRQVSAFTLESNAKDYARLVQTFSIKSFPCIIVMGRGCGAMAVSGEITEGKLLKAFILATSRSSCGTSCGASSGCGS